MAGKSLRRQAWEGGGKQAKRAQLRGISASTGPSWRIPERAPAASPDASPLARTQQQATQSQGEEAPSRPPKKNFADRKKSATNLSPRTLY